MSATRETALLALAADLGASNDELDAATLAAARICDLLQVQCTRLAPVDPDGATLTVIVNHDAQGTNHPEEVVPTSNSLLGRSLTEGALCSHGPNADAVDAVDAAAQGYDSYAAAPLVCASGSIGAFSVARSGSQGFSDDEFALLAALGRTLGSTFARIAESEAAEIARRRKQAATGRVDELDATIAPTLSLAMTTQEVLDTAAAAASQHLAAARVSYLALSADGTSGDLNRLHGPGAELRQSLRVPLATNSPIRALAPGALHYTPDAARLRPAEARAMGTPDSGSLLTAAISADGRVVGALTVGVNDAHSLDDGDRAAMSHLAGLIGEALEQLDAQRDSSESISSSEALLQSLIDGSPIMTALIDGEGEILRVSRLGAQRLGLTPEEMIGKPYARFHAARDWKLLRERLNELGAAGRTHGESQVAPWEVRMLDEEGEPIWTRQHGRLLRDGSDQMLILITAEDIDETRALQQRLDYQLNHDPLTGVSNRAVLESRLADMSRQYVTRGTLLLIDIDHFKLINDRLGHGAGDELLRRVAGDIGREIDEGELSARLGADEFAILCPERDLRSAITLGRRLVSNARVEAPGEVAGLGATLSIGIADLEGTKIDPEEVIAQADAACYAAKAEGGGRVVIANESSEIQRMRLGASSWIDRIERALGNDGFRLYGQPISPLSSGSQRAFEILLRLEGELGQPVSPAAFIPFAEEYSMVARIDRWVIAHTLGALADHPVPARCFINVSGASLDDDGFTASIAQLVRESPVPGSALTFEITETAAARYADRTRAFIQELRSLGCWVALDDFGSGFSSLSQLSELPADVLKIDGVLVRDIATDPRSLALLRSVASMARALGMRTVAEHVENSEILEALRSVGVDWAQGYYLGAPEPLVGVLEELSEASTTDGRTRVR